MTTVIAPPRNRVVDRPPAPVVPVALLCAGVAFLARLAVLISPMGTPDGDGAVSGLMALDAVHGHPWLVWAGQRYAGTVDTWMQAVTLRELGVGKVSLGLPLALIGAATVGVLSWTAGRTLRSRSAALAVGLTLSVVPLWLLLWGTVWPGGYGLSSLFAFSALAIAITRPRVGLPAAAAVGLLCGLALWNQPLAVSQVLVVSVVTLRRAGGLRRALLVAPVALLASLPAFGLWLLGLQDGTDRTLSKLQDQVTLAKAVDPGLIGDRAQILFGPIGRLAFGLGADQRPALLPSWAETTVVVLVVLAALVAAVVCAFRRAAPLVSTMAAVLLTSFAVFVLFPPTQTGNGGVPRYVYPAMYALGTLVGLVLWALLRRRGALPRALGVALAVLVLGSTTLSSGQLTGPGSYTRARPTEGQLQAFAVRLEAAGARCLVGSYWTVYPLALASGEALPGEATTVNRMGVVCGAGPGVTGLFTRPTGQPGPEEQAWRAARPGAQEVQGPGIFALISS